ncbi:MAG: Ribokinase [Dehalococcoidia bacterium]|nr:Ribokinase [Bacillota bacterium]MBT9143615.1 Ribokinase [Bacillota bacterium]
MDKQSSAIRYLVLQFEVPLDIVGYAFAKAKKFGSTTVLNPSPMRPIPNKLIEQTDIFVLNELELAQVVGLTNLISSPEKAVKVALLWRERIGEKTIVVTLGENGLVAIQGNQVIRQSAQKVAKVVDTTGAGDCFCGTFVALLHKRYPFEESLAFAQKAAAYSVQRKGQAYRSRNWEYSTSTKQKEARHENDSLESGNRRPHRANLV